ncbi:MAG TPA: ATP synthase subunit I [Pyrinomonadaceae bacterium]|nr:ATP synthase subunit I [Pyrinomonadaceae bacterium]
MNQAVVTEVDHSLDTRVFRTMLIASLLAVAISLPLAPWRVTFGILIGGALALFSHHWLKSSAAAAIQMSIGANQNRLGLTQFFLRYCVIALVVYLVAVLGIANLTAVLAGLASFVVALMVEAGREFYFAITHREEMN